MDNAYEEAVEYFGLAEGMMLGDWSAGCRYLSAREEGGLDLSVDRRFAWMIDRRQDTTTRPSDCAYDRYLYVMLAGHVML